MSPRWMLLFALSGCLGGQNAALGPGAAMHRDGGCVSQDDCTDGLICEPTTVGATSGACVPPSTTLCGSCAADSDCGSATARCMQTPGDVAAACHIDCSLSWLACPPDYNCLQVLDGAAKRQLCLPTSYVCTAAMGGACTNNATQPCSVTGAAGTCSGKRTCVNGTFGPCDAAQPAFRTSCSETAPPGCTEALAPAATSTASDCGRCGNVCPGTASSTADTACTDAAAGTCGISCRGDNYDLDGNAANGCEAPDGDSANHDQSTATPFAATDCDDGDSKNSFSGQLLSDVRIHKNPAVVDFSTNAGAAPHWFSVVSAGGTFCQDDYSLTFTTTGGPDVPCYQASIVTDKTINSVPITGAGSASVSGGAGSYSDGSTIYFKVEKTCTTATPFDVSYTVSYHL